MTLASLLLLSILAALLAFMLGALVLEAFWAIRTRAEARGPLFGALRHPMPVRPRNRRA